MINRNELRYNNWAYGSIRQNEPMQIKSIDNTICKLGEYLEDYESINPIQLTPEILEKAGFVKQICDRDTAWELQINDEEKFLYAKNYKMYFGKQGVAQYEWLSVRPEYVHQLQNLYFVITEGKELEIKF